VLGAATGIALGIAGAFAARPFVEELLVHARGGGYRVFPQALAAIAGLALVTGLAAALVPAFATARQSVVSSLAGRRGVTRSRKRWIAAGLVMIGTGAAITVAGALRTEASVMLAGLVLAELGLVLCTPALVGLAARAGRLLPLAPRVALRDAARNRAAAAPAISAVMAAVAGSVLLGMVIVSDREHSRDQWYQEHPTGTVLAYLAGGAVSPEAATRAIQATLPVDEVHQVGRPVCPADADAYCGIEVGINDLCPQLGVLRFGELSDADRAAAAANPHCDPRLLNTAGGVVVDDGSALATLSGASGDDLRRARETLEAGGVVVRSQHQIVDGMVTLAVVRPDPEGDPGGPPTMVAGSVYVFPGHEATVLTVPGYLLTSGIGPGSAVVPPAVVERAGLAVTTDRVVATPSRMPSEADRERFAAAMRALEAFGTVETGWVASTDPLLWLLAGAAGLITIGAAAIGTGLAAADGRAALSTLAAVGASPRLRRALSVSQSGVIAGLGSLLGSLAGIGAAYAVVGARNQEPWVRLWPGVPIEPVLPWATLAVTLVAVPVIAVLGAGLFTRSRLPIERRL
jgi:putative ABC transport system permease protein